MNEIDKKTNARLSHVYWIGGSACAGKSSTANLLAEKHGFKLYHTDLAFDDHTERNPIEECPTMHQRYRLNWNEKWNRDLSTLIHEEFEAFREQFAYILEDLLKMPDSAPIIVEGNALLPELVEKVTTNKYQAVWRIPTEDFQRATYPKRGRWVQEALNKCENPEEAFRNWMERDVIFARTVAEQAKSLGYKVLTIDGSRSLKESATLVEKHFKLKK
ncbi:hypothetical protein [Pseudalkalibacillus caeni]|uniref:Uncharacterized protein n=1 Tax=Exobacillus caeni TaxID=2574798 RepID=A0A5R9F1U4_9BACL|nr:hypothetical protein [Pseudalkalibacillus caeni]TLS37602.1 hypothetical protein FCL54_10715 [Pseudalkalibacillus caeni]